MILYIRYFFTGMALTLTIYHFLVWAGRRRDLSNLSFSLFNLTFVIFLSGTSISAYLKSTAYSIITSHLMCCIMSTVFPFFAYTVHIIAEELKKHVIRCIIVIYIINISGIFIFIFTGGFPFFSIAGFIITIIIIVFINIICAIYIVKNNLHKKEETRLFVIGYFFLLISLLFCLFFYTFFNTPTLLLYSALFLYISFAIILFVFAYTLTRQFNKEHMDLKELKDTLEKKVDDRTKQLKEVNKQKTQFFINLAHETKTPLTLIGNYFNEYCKMKGESYESEIIKSNLEKLKRDMVNFLDYEKLQSGQVFYNHNHIIDFSSLAAMQVFLFKELALRRKITFVTDIEEQVFIKMDPSAAERVVNNLLDNAVKYSLPDGFINVTLKTANNHITFTVSDTGPGISAHQQKQIFKPFLQLSHHKRNIQGIGMGLNIVKTIVDEVNGKIQCVSKEGKGANFNVIFPRFYPVEGDSIDEYDPGHSSFIPIITRQTLPGEEYTQGKATLFIVEDNLEMLYYLQTKFRHYYNVFYALNGKEALEKIVTIPRPDVIISDIMMDTMDGFEFYDRLQEIDNFTTVPFIFLTALTSTTDKIKSLYKGVIDYIYKPFNIDELSGKIHSVLKIYAALKRENLLSLGERLFHYLKHRNGTKKDFAKDFRDKKESVMKALYEQYGISDRQIQIIALLKIGLLRKEICNKLDISMNTLKTHMSRLYEKCEVDNKTELLNIFY